MDSPLKKAMLYNAVFRLAFSLAALGFRVFQALVLRPAIEDQMVPTTYGENQRLAVVSM